jgi:isopropylmalate/homocitrate/citramalate synthase/isocitrate/isopropylmalate dehydrogenase
VRLELGAQTKEQRVRRIKIFDTTLRDGEQSPGIALRPDQKAEVALVLEHLGVDVVEAGFAASSPGDFEGVAAVSEAVSSVTVASLCRTTRGDIDASVEALQGAPRSRLHVFIATSPLHMERKLGLTPEQVLERVESAVTYARGQAEEVEFSAEDATRSEPAFLAEVCRAAIRAGADVINLPDTVGYALPDELAGLLAEVRSLCPELERVELSVHCHDDLGLAVANSLAGVAAGATQVECTVNGIGERAGNAALEEVVMALRVRAAAFGAETRVDPRWLHDASTLVSEVTGYAVQRNKAIVGANAFAHEAGIHQEALGATRVRSGVRRGRVPSRPRRGRPRVRALQTARRPRGPSLALRRLPGGTCMKSTHTVACLAGDGVGPELMAEATRALSCVSKLHSVEVEEVHLPFAGEALTRSGHPLPHSTRKAYRQADAILVASPHEPALEGIKADLELAWRVARVHVPPAGDLLVIGAVASWANRIAVGRAFSRAASRRGRVTSVGSSPDWRELIQAEQARWGAMAVEHLTVGETLVRLREAPSELDVVVTEPQLVAPVADAAAHLTGSPATVAHGWLPERGPGVFAPETCDSSDVAGFGVADPTGMLLTASLLLAEGLQRRSAARTLERAVGAAERLNGSSRTGTRSFTDAVIELLPEARTDVELFEEAWG